MRSIYEDKDRWVWRYWVKFWYDRSAIGAEEAWETIRQDGWYTARFKTIDKALEAAEAHYEAWLRSLEPAKPVHTWKP